MLQKYDRRGEVNIGREKVILFRTIFFHCR